jgi:hypothetical protein
MGFYVHRDREVVFITSSQNYSGGQGILALQKCNAHGFYPKNLETLEKIFRII